MTISMFSASAPLFERQLSAMLNWLDKAEAFATARKFDPDSFLVLRLAPDMLPLSKQIQIASDAVKGCMSRLGGTEVPKWDDNEVTLKDLRTRIERTLALVRQTPAASFEGSEAREIVVPLRNREPMRFSGEDYLRHWALPNFFFHVSMTYALLRAAGVELGKADYLGGA